MCKSAGDLSAEKLSKVYKRFVRIYHPDKNIGNEKIAEAAVKNLNEACEVLQHKIQRKSYNSWMSLEEAEAIFSIMLDGGDPFTNVGQASVVKKVSSSGLPVPCQTPRAGPQQPATNQNSPRTSAGRSASPRRTPAPTPPHQARNNNFGAYADRAATPRRPPRPEPQQQPAYYDFAGVYFAAYARREAAYAEAAYAEARRRDAERVMNDRGATSDENWWDEHCRKNDFRNPSADCRRRNDSAAPMPNAQFMGNRCARRVSRSPSVGRGPLPPRRTSGEERIGAPRVSCTPRNSAGPLPPKQN
mmetsp:Transcript_57211/g.90946  ORF Transcript_57211/g.90946 Transcript_57211/m.90946 type:complete len:302 (+) Transcript_57211:56-961(+)